jgi:hypothetical protein
MKLYIYKKKFFNDERRFASGVGSGGWNGYSKWYFKNINKFNLNFLKKNRILNFFFFFFFFFFFCRDPL